MNDLSRVKLTDIVKLQDITKKHDVSYKPEHGKTYNSGKNSIPIIF